MLTHPTHDRLMALGLTGMAKALEEQRRQPDIEALSFEERLGLLVDREAIERENKRLASRLKFAGLRQTATVEDADMKIARGLDVMAEPCPARTRCSPGSPPATGSPAIRTWPSSAKPGWARVGSPVRSATSCGTRASPRRVPGRSLGALSPRATPVRRPGARARRRSPCSPAEDTGARRPADPRRLGALAPVTHEQARDLLEIIDDRHGRWQRRSRIKSGTTSQLPVEHWHELIPNPTIADAILDRLVHVVPEARFAATRTGSPSMARASEKGLPRRALTALPDGDQHRPIVSTAPTRGHQPAGVAGITGMGGRLRLEQVAGFDRNPRPTSSESAASRAIFCLRPNPRRTRRSIPGSTAPSMRSMAPP